MSRHRIAMGMIGLLAVVAPIQAQRQSNSRINTSGHITDLTTGNPVSGALVEFPGLGKQALTDRNGRFALTGIRPGKHKIVVTQLGFKTVMREVTIAQNEPLGIIPMDPDPVMLKGIEVQVDRLETRRRAIGVSAQAFGRDELLATTSWNAAEFARTRLMLIPCPSGRGLCLHHRGQTIPPVIYIDERRAFGIEELEAYPVFDLYLVESFDNGRMIRVYTNWFMQSLARNGMRLQQIIIW
jgi:hypothetical protein